MCAHPCRDKIDTFAYTQEKKAWAGKGGGGGKGAKGGKGKEVKLTQKEITMIAVEKTKVEKQMGDVQAWSTAAASIPSLAKRLEFMSRKLLDLSHPEVRRHTHEHTRTHTHTHTHLHANATITITSTITVTITITTTITTIITTITITITTNITILIIITTTTITITITITTHRQPSRVT